MLKFTGRKERIMATISIKKQRSKEKTSKVKDLSGDPFFVKKAKEAIAFIKKNGAPSTAKK